MDTYPIKSKNTNSLLTVKNVIFAGLIIFAIWYFADSCNKKTVVVPVVKPSTELIKVVNLAEEEKKRIEDSFNIVLNKLDRMNDKQYQDYVLLLNENAVLANQNEILSIPIPDTCQQLNAAWKSKYNTYVAQTNKTTQSATNTIRGLNTSIATQKKFLASKDSAYAKIKNAWDTCISGYQKLEKFAKQNKPKREVSAGINMMSGYSLPLKPEFGLMLGYKNKKGTELLVGYYTNNQISIGLKKPLIRF